MSESLTKYYKIPTRAASYNKIDRIISAETGGKSFHIIIKGSYISRVCSKYSLVTGIIKLISPQTISMHYSVILQSHVYKFLFITMHVFFVILNQLNAWIFDILMNAKSVYDIMFDHLVITFRRFNR